MKIGILNLTKKEVKKHSDLCRKVLAKFSELEKYYGKISFFLVDDSSIPLYRNRAAEILGVANVPSPSKVSSALAVEGQGVLTLRADMLEAESPDLREFIIHEECCHLIDYGGDSKPKSNAFWQMWNIYKLSNRPHFGEKVMRELNDHFNHFNANRLLIKHDLKQWLMFKKDYYGAGYRSKIDDDYASIESKYDRVETLTIMMAQLIKVVSFYNVVLSVESKNLCSSQQEIVGEMANSIRSTISTMESYARRTTAKVPQIASWFDREKFRDQDTFFKRAQELWNLLGLFTQKDAGTKGIKFTHIAIGAERSWRSPSMVKIKNAPSFDVETILVCDLPFPLSRLPDGAYEMKENGHTVKLVVRKIKRNIETVKELTGWTPQGDLEIIGDRFGRISFSRLEIHIPYRIDEPMFDYLCPKCEVEVEKGANKCSVCHHTFDPEKAKRRPRLHRAKTKAIELVNQFLSVYRFTFMDFFIDYIRYQDIISYEIKYVLTDGTEANWTEDFSTTGEVVEGRTLLASTDDIGIFKKILVSNREMRMRISDQLLSSAENRIHMEEYRLAILEAVMALEAVISEYVLAKGYPLIMSQNPKLRKRFHNIKSYNRWRGLTNKTIDVWGVISRHIKQLEPSIFSGCKQLIWKRNDIVHDQLTNVDYNDAKKALWYIKSMIGYIERL